MSLPHDIIETNVINYVWPGEFWKIPLVWRGVNLYNIFLGFWEQNTYIYRFHLSTVIHINIDDDRIAYFNVDLFWNSQPYSLLNKNFCYWWGSEDDMNYLALWYYFSKSYYGFIDVTYIEGEIGHRGFHQYWIITDTERL